MKQLALIQFREERQREREREREDSIFSGLILLTLLTYDIDSTLEIADGDKILTSENEKPSNGKFNKEI